MSVAKLNADELGAFVAVAQLSNSIEFSQGLRLAEAISVSNQIAWSERYSDEIDAVDRDEIEKFALNYLANPETLLDAHIGPISSNVATHHVAVLALRDTEKACKNWLDAKKREKLRLEQNAVAYSEAGHLPTFSCEDIVRECKSRGMHRVIFATYHVSECDGQSDYYGSRSTRRVVIGYGKGTKESFPQLRKAAATFVPTSHLGPGKNRWTVSARYETDNGGRIRHEHLHGEDGRRMEFETGDEAAQYARDLVSNHPECQEGYVGGVGFPYFAKANGFECHYHSVEHRETYSMGKGNYLGIDGYHGWHVSSLPVDYVSKGLYEVTPNASPSLIESKPPQVDLTPELMPATDPIEADISYLSWL